MPLPALTLAATRTPWIITDEMIAEVVQGLQRRPHPGSRDAFAMPSWRARRPGFWVRMKAMALVFDERKAIDILKGRFASAEGAITTFGTAAGRRQRRTAGRA
jgi:hypothetical protein